MILRQSTAVDVLIGPFLDLTDGATAESGETPTVKLSKNGQALAAKSDVTVPLHDADGYYNCELDATDTNTIGQLVITVAKSATALPVRHEFDVVDEAVYDALFGTTALATATNITAGTITTVTNLTNAPGAGDFTATMKTSIGTAVAASAVASVTGNVGGNVGGSVGSVVGAVGSVTGLTASDVGAIKAKTDSLTFTQAGNVDANIQYVNDALVNGTGALGDEWGP